MHESSCIDGSARPIFGTPDQPSDRALFEVKLEFGLSKLDTLRALLERASSIDRERTRMTRHAFLVFLQERGIGPDTSTLLASFTATHDALEAAIMNGRPAAEIEARRARCLAIVDRQITRH
jgi:hypothetical protein